MERNIKTAPVVPSSTTLLNQEGYAVGSDGAKTGTLGDFVYGVVRKGRPTGEATEVITNGECEARVAWGGSTISVDEELTGGASGELVSATVGTHQVRAIAMESITADSLYQVFLF